MVIRSGAMMSKKKGNVGRPEFRDWVNRQDDPKWGLLPLTHICKGLVAGDIGRDDQINPRESPSNPDFLDGPLA